MMLKGKDIKTEQKILDDALDKAVSWRNVPSTESLFDLSANSNTKLDELLLEVSIVNNHVAAI
jgi:hypothetical protein